MNQVTLHPNVYSTGPDKGLVALLERVWVREHTPGEGVIYIISGFANYNGGVSFYDVIKRHTDAGGEAKAVFSGSTNSRLSSKQVVKELLECGVDVQVVNRKKLLHAKCYGTSNTDGETLIVTSGNFTGPGMSQNGEMSVLLDKATVSSMGFSWGSMYADLFSQRWNFYRPELSDLTTPAWDLLYDEVRAAGASLDETEAVTMVVVLVHSDTVRVNASRGTAAGKGTLDFRLSKDSFSFFPPLLIVNRRGVKPSYSCHINVNYVDLSITSRVTVNFQAGNNSDFRLGVGKYRHTGVADAGDLAVISRVSEKDYQIRILGQGTAPFNALEPYATTYIGHQGKRYGYLSNQEAQDLLGLRF